MNKTNAIMTAQVPFPIDANYKISPNEKCHIQLEFDLVYEDWQLFKEHQAYFNEHNQTEDDMGDCMLGLITWAIHQMYEARTGKKFVLRMDRKSN